MSDDDEQTLSEAATRVLEDEDKTAPPAVDPPRRAGVGVDAAADAALRSASAPRPAASPSMRSEAARGLAPGTVLFGEYEIVSVLGTGGMGEVYRAHHRRLDEHRAIKVMHAELSTRRGASEFFYREAKALLAVRHPAVVHCHDLLSDESGRVYLIMELIEGVPLSKKLASGPLSPDEVAILGARVAHGLAAAHRKGVIHRDLSPDNIVLPNGRVQEAKIIDFGIAKLLEQGDGTIVDGFKGKLSYASPEQLGFSGGKIDGRSDLYSLGLVLAAAALGRPMPMGTTVVEAVDARRALRSLPDGIPMGLRSAIQPLLALDPDDRPRHVDRLFVAPGAFDAISESGLDASGPMPGASRAARGRVGEGRPWERRPERSAPARGRTFALGAAALLLVAGGLFAVVRSQQDDSLARSTPDRPAGESTPAPEAAEASRDSAEQETALAEPAESEPSAPTAPEPVVQPKVAPPDRKSERPAIARADATRPSRGGPSASDRIRIVGLLTSAKIALGEDHLMSPAGDNAYEKFRAVLALDPRNADARRGLHEIAKRYLARARESFEQGDRAAAREHVRRARQADGGLAGLRLLERRMSER